MEGHCFTANCGTDPAENLASAAKQRSLISNSKYLVLEGSHIYFSHQKEFRAKIKKKTNNQTKKTPNPQTQNKQYKRTKPQQNKTKEKPNQPVESC